jgi:hypothetical protein
MRRHVEAMRRDIVNIHATVPSVPPFYGPLYNHAEATRQGFVNIHATPRRGCAPRLCKTYMRLRRLRRQAAAKSPTNLRYIALILLDLRTRCEESAARRRGRIDLQTRTQCEYRCEEGATESAARRRGRFDLRTRTKETPLLKCSNPKLNPILLAGAFFYSNARKHRNKPVFFAGLPSARAFSYAR